MGNKTWGMDDNLIVLLIKEIREEESILFYLIAYTENRNQKNDLVVGLILPSSVLP